RDLGRQRRQQPESGGPGSNCPTRRRPALIRLPAHPRHSSRASGKVMPKKSSDTDRASSHPTELERAMRACRSALAVCAMFSLAINVLMLTLPVYMLQVYDRVLTTGRGETLVMLTLIATIALAVMCALDALRTSITIRVGCWLNEQLGPAYLACAVRGRLQGDVFRGRASARHFPDPELHRDAGVDRF